MWHEHVLQDLRTGEEAMRPRRRLAPRYIYRLLDPVQPGMST